ncbi:MAG: hypothetical protein J6Q78_02115, partial [Clostridia bacterium]|nr:hypothetical protein [Clostridia bacterium]
LMIVTCFVACDNVETDDKDTETDGNQSTNTGDGDKKDENAGDKNNGGENAGDENNGGENTGDENNGGENAGDENTGDENNGDENTEPEDTRPFAGKVCVTFGASNTWYDGNAYTWGKAKGEIAVGYQHYMREELGMTVHNKGVSGITMPDTIRNHVMNPAYANLWTGVDYVTIKGGINEERRNTPMGTLMPKGSTFDTNTFIGSIQAGVEYLLEKNPDITIMLLTTTNAWIYADGVGQEGYAYDYDKENQPKVDGRIPEKWADAMKEIAELYGLPVCDLYNEVKFDTVEDREKYFNDPEPPVNQLYSAHPNAEGYKIVADVIIDSFMELLEEK